MDDNHYISHLERNKQRFEFGSWTAIDEGHDSETALITKEPWGCLILNGDHRKEYEDLVDQGYEACYNYYVSKSEQKSSWSED